MPKENQVGCAKTLVSLEEMRKNPYRAVLCYPKPTDEEVEKRIRELRELGVEALEFIGEKSVENLSVLGKGHVGVVVAARFQGKRFALKIRRVDADRPTMEWEAKLLQKANSCGVGPQLIAYSKNFLLMEYVEGETLDKWLKKTISDEDTDELREVLGKILQSCRALDEAGLDHGELSNPSHHVVVKPDKQPVLIDFETASQSRKVSNVTSMCQYLFIGGTYAEQIRKLMKTKPVEEVIQALREYKKKLSEEAFAKVLEATNLASALLSNRHDTERGFSDVALALQPPKKDIPTLVLRNTKRLSRKRRAHSSKLPKRRDRAKDDARRNTLPKPLQIQRRRNRSHRTNRSKTQLPPRHRPTKKEGNARKTQREAID